MKKFVSILLIVSMLMTFFTVIGAGTVTAFAADDVAAVAETAEGMSLAEVIKTFIAFVRAIWEYIQNNGGLGMVLDAVYDLLAQLGLDIDGIYDWIQNSGIVELIAKIFF